MEIGLLAFAIIWILILFYALNKKRLEVRDKQKQIEEYKTASELLKKELNDLKITIDNQNIKITGLSKFENILEIDKEAIKITQNAEEEVARLTKQSFAILEEAESDATTIIENAEARATEIETESKTILSDARVRSKTILEKADTRLSRAVLESTRIIKEAEEKAEETAGSAFTAMRNAELYENTVTAMKNIIKGYGDKYLKPTFSLLDDLADEFSHTDAGQNLKIARERNYSMILNGVAAKCLYVEQNRKQTAINFVLDAFNGKVDSVLSQVKKDNFGTLEQRINDAFFIVNNNGKAFRDAQISDEYLQSRLDELKWAVIVQELKSQEREEQRLIREQIREEEKARREYEKAIRDADKEEQLLKKLIEKAQKEVDKANEEERARYLEKLHDLEGKLKEAEEKNQRAISMAQQTKAGNVYVISNVGSFGEDVFKIGMTRRLEPLDRVRELGDASVPFEFDVHAMIYSENAPQLERDLHKRFMKLQVNKVNPRKEFFKVSLLDIRDVVEKNGLSVKWTMTAQARQYRESLAITEAIKKDKSLEESWERHQIEIEDEEVVEIEDTL